VSCAMVTVLFYGVCKMMTARAFKWRLFELATAACFECTLIPGFGQSLVQHFSSA